MLASGGIIAATRMYAGAADEQAARLTAGDKTAIFAKKALGAVTFGLYAGGREEREKLEQLIAQQRFAWKTGAAAVLLFILAAALLLGRSLFKQLKSREEQEFALAIKKLLALSFFMFAVGVASPILGFVAYKDFPLIGQVVFKFQSKDIISTIIVLFASGNILIGLLITLFSLLTPLGKLYLSFVAVGTGNAEKRHKYIAMIKAIGKWSMADVFTVAILLAYFTMNKDEFTDAWVGVGIYFFSAYCLISMLAAQQMLKRLH